MAEVNDWASSADADRDATERDQEVSSTLQQKKCVQVTLIQIIIQINTIKM